MPLETDRYSCGHLLALLQVLQPATRPGGSLTVKVGRLAIQLKVSDVLPMGRPSNKSKAGAEEQRRNQQRTETQSGSGPAAQGVWHCCVCQKSQCCP